MRICGSDVLSRLGTCDILRCGLLQATSVRFPRRSHLVLAVSRAVVTGAHASRVVRFLRGIVYRHYKVGLGVFPRCQGPRRDGCQGGSRRRVQRRITKVITQAGLIVRKGSRRARRGRGAIRARRGAGAVTGATKGHTSTSGGNAGCTGPGRGFRGQKRFHQGFRSSGNGGSVGPSMVCKESFRRRDVRVRGVSKPVKRIIVHKGVLSMSAHRVHGRGAVVVFSIASFASAVILGVFTKGSSMPRLLGRVDKKGFIHIGNITAVSGFSDRLAVNSVIKVGGYTSFAAIHVSADMRGHVRLRYRAGVDSVSNISSIGSVIGHTVG